MIIYQATKAQFLDHALRGDIEDVVSEQFLATTGRTVQDHKQCAPASAHAPAA